MSQLCLMLKDYSLSWATRVDIPCGVQKRILVEVEEQLQQLLASVFENYKGLDEVSISGLAETFTEAMGSVAPALVPAVQLFTLTHDILSVEAQSTLRNYFKVSFHQLHYLLVIEYLANLFRTPKEETDHCRVTVVRSLFSRLTFLKSESFQA